MATDSSATVSSYDLRIDSLLSFHDRLAAFKDGSDTPRAYLERCLAVIDALEGEINALRHSTLSALVPQRMPFIRKVDRSNRRDL